MEELFRTMGTEERGGGVEGILLVYTVRLHEYEDPNWRGKEWW